jgi:hypothetical protein
MLEKVNEIMKKNNFPGYINIMTTEKVIVPYHSEIKKFF